MIENKNRVIISLCVVKQNHKHQYAFAIKIIKRLGIEDRFLNKMKIIDKKLTVKITHSKVKRFSAKTKMDTELLVITSAQHSPGTSSRAKGAACEAVKT